MIPPPPRSTLFPYTTLFRSLHATKSVLSHQWLNLTPIRLKRSRSEEHTSELQSRGHLVCRLLLEKKKILNRARPNQTILNKQLRNPTLYITARYDSPNSTTK